MAMDYAARSQAVRDAIFVGRVGIGLVKLCTYITASETNVTNHAARASLASKIMNDVNAYAPHFAFAVIAAPVNDNANSTTDITDNSIQSALETSFNSFIPV